MDHLNSVIEVMPLGARLDVPLLRRAMSLSDSDPRAPAQQQKQLAVTAGAGGSQNLRLDCVPVGGGECRLVSELSTEKNTPDALVEQKRSPNHPPNYARDEARSLDSLLFGSLKAHRCPNDSIPH